MSDSLKERLHAAVHDDRLSTGALYREALARIEELEESYAAAQYQIRLAYDKGDRDRATIAKLEAEIKRLRAFIWDSGLAQDEFNSR